MFHASSQKTTVIFLCNYCTRKLRFHDTDKFRLELNENYRMFLKYKLYKIGGENFIRSDLFLNILYNFFALGKTKEVMSFLEANIDNILPSHRKNMLAVSNALIWFENGNFGESLKNASLIKTNTFLFKDVAKLLILKNHYELKNFDVAAGLALSYRNFLNDNKNLSSLYKEKGLRFLHYYEILWKVFDGKAGKTELKEIENAIAADNRLLETIWILEKITELS